MHSFTKFFPLLPMEHNPCNDKLARSYVQPLLYFTYEQSNLYMLITKDFSCDNNKVKMIANIV